MMAKVKRHTPLARVCVWFWFFRSTTTRAAHRWGGLEVTVPEMVSSGTYSERPQVYLGTKGRVVRVGTVLYEGKSESINGTRIPRGRRQTAGPRTGW